MKTNSTWPQGLGAPRVSVQALLDCVQNPRHCGGKGGCEGATAELAFDYMQTKGVPLESKLPYRPADTGKCPIEPYPSDWVRVTLSGWQALPRNQAQPLMRALVEDGPVVVAVAAHDWYHYTSGVFDECQKDAIPNHSVLARGYGDIAGTKYWLLQNSWGEKWGMRGHIRLLRHDDEDGWCGIDSRPQDGSACDGEADQNITVCGSCGILYDPIVPRVGPVMIGEVPYTATSAALAARPDAGTLVDMAKLNEGLAAYQGQGSGNVGDQTQDALSYANAPESTDPANAAPQQDRTVQNFVTAKGEDEPVSEKLFPLSADADDVADELPAEGITRTSSRSKPDISLASDAKHLESGNDALESNGALGSYLR